MLLLYTESLNDCKTRTKSQKILAHKTLIYLLKFIFLLQKVELSDDKNEDSGISPGHYTSNSTSPTSARASPAVNCSLDPENANSKAQGSAVDYNSNLYRPSDSSVSFENMHSAMSGNPEIKGEQPLMDGPSTSKSYPDINQNDENMQCPVCAFISENRYFSHLIIMFLRVCHILP